VSLKELYSVLRPNTPYTVISLENTVVTGGFFLSCHTLYETLIGKIHSFVLPSLLTEGSRLPFSTFIRRIVHYMHNAYVVNDSSDRSHLLTFKSLDDIRDLFSLVTMAIFLNVFDERTYETCSESHRIDSAILEKCHDVFDLNAIPVFERHHICYIRGLSFDLLEWFFENYSFSSVELEEEDIDAFGTIFIPFAVGIGRQILKYKRDAEDRRYASSSSFDQVKRQVQSALFPLKFARDTWLEEKAAAEEKNHEREVDDEDDEAGIRDLFCDISEYSFKIREIPEERRCSGKYFEEGKTEADKRFFKGLSSQFDFKEFGENPFNLNDHCINWYE
jgi:hypothetical protein